MLDKQKNNSIEIILEQVEDAKRITKRVMERAPEAGSGRELIDELAVCTVVVRKMMQKADTNQLYLAIFDVADLLFEANRYLGYTYLQFHWMGMVVSYIQTSRDFDDFVHWEFLQKWHRPLFVDLRRKHHQLISGLRDLYKALGGVLDRRLEPMMTRPHPLDRIENFNIR